jgi:O-antigen/teichoic acid export membrane protein
MFYISSYALSGGSSFLALFIASLTIDQGDFGVLSLIVSIQYFTSQFSCLGLQFSALYYESKNDGGNYFVNHYLNISLLSILVGVILYFTYDYVFVHFSQRLLEFKIYIILVSYLMAGNKVFMASLNGAKRFTFLSVLHCLKGAVTMFGIGYCFWLESPIKDYVYYVFLLPELLLYLVYSFISFKQIYLFKLVSFKDVLLSDIRFGFKSFWGAIFLESNTKVDLFFVSYFYSDSISGIYGFISIFSDVVLQFTTVMRNLFNPEFTAISESDIDVKTKNTRLFEILKKGYVYIFPVIFVLGIGFYCLLTMIPELDKYYLGEDVFYIMFPTLLFISPLFIFFQYFGQIGLPLTQSVFFAKMVVVNVILNLILVPRLGMIGAALSTSCAYLLYFMMKFNFIKIKSSRDL